MAMTHPIWRYIVFRVNRSQRRILPTWSYLKNHFQDHTEKIFMGSRGDVELCIGPCDEKPLTDIHNAEDIEKVQDKHKSRRFVVKSSVLADWSPVFKSMLFGGFAESKPAHGPWVVHLPDDDVWGMFVILAIAHGWDSAVPRTLEDLELQQVIRLADKYLIDCRLGVWYRQWLPTSMAATNLPVALCTNAWDVGAEKTFTNLIFLAAHKSTLERDWDPNCPVDLLVSSTYFWPSRNFNGQEVLKRARKSMRAALLKYLSDKIRDCYVSRVCRGTGERSSQQTCSALILGYVMITCNRFHLYSDVLLSGASPYEKTYLDSSPFELIEVIKYMRICMPHAEGHDCDPFHDLDDAVAKMWETLPSPLSPQTRQILQENAEKSGYIKKSKLPAVDVESWRLQVANSERKG